MTIARATGFTINSGAHGAIPSIMLNVNWPEVGLATLWTLQRGRA